MHTCAGAVWLLVSPALGFWGRWVHVHGAVRPARVISVVGRMQAGGRVRASTSGDTELEMIG